MLFLGHRFNIILEVDFKLYIEFICMVSFLSFFIHMLGNLINFYIGFYTMKITQKSFWSKLMEFFGLLRILIEKLLVFAVNSSAFNWIPSMFFCGNVWEEASDGTSCINSIRENRFLCNLLIDVQHFIWN